MKKITFILLFLLISFLGNAQLANYTQEEGKVTEYEMLMTEYEKDKDAEAVTIYDLGEYYFVGDRTQGDFLLYMEKRIKIKILKREGIDYANFEIPYYKEKQNWEKIPLIKGAVYNVENGKLKITELTIENISDEKISDNIRLKKIAFADVREGSVIELSYTIETPYFSKMREWVFQKRIPVVSSRLNYRAIPYYEYNYQVKGINKLDEFESVTNFQEKRFEQLIYNETDFKFGMKDIPAFRDEEFITSPKDYLIAVNFHLSKLRDLNTWVEKDIFITWSTICNDFLKNDKFGKFIQNSEKEAKKVFKTLALNNKTPLQKLEAIAEHVKYNYKWNGVNGEYANDKLSDFLKNKTGNSGNINLFLVGLLQAANIEVYPVVLSTRDNGFIYKDYPSRDFFNYVITQARIDGKVYNIDATESLLYFNDLPQRCINVEGLVVKPKSEEWTYTVQKGVFVTQKELELTIVPGESKVRVNARFAGTGGSAYDFRQIYLGKKGNLSKYLKDKNNIDVKGAVEVPEKDVLKRPFMFSFDFDMGIENTPNKLSINPFCNLAISGNPFKQDQRTYPVDLVYMRGDNYRSVVNIPEGYKVEYMPDSFTIDNDLMTITYTAKVENNDITVNAGYSFKQIVYAAEDYAKLQSLFTDIIKKFSEMVVLEKE
ncbi:MAG: DUF3857 domain-containing protein [Prevotella sp.]|jgi:transglutaminase-like putative cysteine protease|nr:DUF3857 domain-containing protein [Prevotella sp.]